MRIGTIAVRDALGDDVPGITDKNIQEALWHYYYDVEKTVNYLLQSMTASKDTGKKKKAKGRSTFLHSRSGVMAVRHDGVLGIVAGIENGKGFGGASHLSHTSGRYRRILTNVKYL